jgi:hypothetical protein
MQVLDQADLIEQGCLGLEVDEEVDIAVRPSLAPGDGPEHADTRRATAPCRGENLSPPRPHHVQGRHGAQGTSGPNSGPPAAEVVRAVTPSGARSRRSNP